LLQAIAENALAQERGDGAHDVLELPISDSDRQMLAKIILQEDEPLTPELLDGALEALRYRSQLSQREGEIKRGIVEAERRNDVAALLRLKQEKLELDRKLAGF
jgi:FixJ family two-component response regulator